MTDKQRALLEELMVTVRELNRECEQDAAFNDYVADMLIFDSEIEEIEGIIEDHLYEPMM